MKLIILFIIAYLLGAVPSGVWIGKLFFNKDIRTEGSGNIGTTNTFRVLGKTAGTVVMIMDIAKGTIATLLPTFFGIQHINPLIFGVFAILGHTFSIFDRFNGGKAVATSAGMLLAYNPWFFVFAAALWVSLIYITSMVSLASMIAFSIVTVVSLWLRDPYLTILALLLTGFIFYRHRTNIKRIKAGTENMVHFGLGYKKRTEK
ncbi:putative membrane protein [Secundilactobacillus oryzae JCM 18671]|uniref:Glycerol-3-phosphate acyltransferase n=1 Tax=Secundilactobacillus oryzae JCM 18671 TaxID=1291743 RepID=A0A081BIC8_9LACO|nr:glycerol-3-phosphate 1-O-acyltransferase PlsY [Secundilactobacillus oryzae]GAK47796.1 putative membrane protein [Secundilactobacillus oryzae JCM 18671]